MEPVVTIIIGEAKAEPGHEEGIASLEGQDWPRERMEIICLKDPSSSLTRQRNSAVRQAKGEMVGFLDGDTKVHPHWLKELAKPLMEGWSFSTPWVLDEAGKETIFARGFMSLLGHSLWPQEEPSKEPRPVLFPCPVSFLVRKEAFLEVGGFDEDYGGPYEELDLGWRLWLRGKKGLFVPKALAFFKNPPSPLGDPEEEQFHQEKNRLMTIVKNYEEKNLHRALSLSLLLLMSKAKTSEPVVRCLAYFVDTIETLWARREAVQKGKSLDDESIFRLSDTPLNWPQEVSQDPEALGWFLGETKSLLSTFCHA